MPVWRLPVSLIHLSFSALLKALDVTGLGTYQNLASAFRRSSMRFGAFAPTPIRKVAKFQLPELSLESSIILDR